MIALVVSVGQLFVSTPMLVQWYMRPKLVVTGGGSEVGGDFGNVGTFRVRNHGRGPATQLHLGLIAEVGSKITVMPHYPTEVDADGEVPVGFVQNFRVTVDRLYQGEELVVLVLNPEGEPLRADLAKILRSERLGELPRATFVRSAEGPGIVEQPKDGSGDERRLRSGP